MPRIEAGRPFGYARGMEVGRPLFRGLSLLIAFGALGCSGATRLAFTPSELRAEVERRAGDRAPEGIAIPYEVNESAIARSRAVVERAPRGGARLRALIELVSAPSPEGFGLRYRWAGTQTADETLARGEGNCVSLASVLVGLARGLGWRAFYAEGGTLREEQDLDHEIGVRADHMVVLIVAEGMRGVVDFRAMRSRGAIRVIDDLSAYAHFVNNRGFERIIQARREGRPVPWQRALADFALASSVAPRLARAWNNQGIALAQLGRIEEAREAYRRAQEIDGDLESARKNLRILDAGTASRRGAESQPVGASPGPPIGSR
jgi:tetratricopeptide (TPR) repeat protein